MPLLEISLFTLLLFDFHMAADPTSSKCAPSILITFINMMLHNTENKEKVPSPCSPYMFIYQVSFVCLSLIR